MGVLSIGNISDEMPFDGLVRLDLNGNWEPDLATKWKSNKAGTVWTFWLRQNVAWSDGQPFTAADVIETYKFITNPKIKISYSTGFDQIKSLKAIGKYEVQYTVDPPVGRFLADIAASDILPAHIFSTLTPTQINDDKYPQADQPVGTGAYEVQTWVHGRGGGGRRSPRRTARTPRRRNLWKRGPIAHVRRWAGRREVGRVASVLLVPMSDAEYRRWRSDAVKGYAENHAAAGDLSPEDARLLAESDFRELLPDGAHTAGMHFSSVKEAETRDTVGMIWFAERGGRTGREAFIYDIVVRPDVRGRGYARAALAAIESRVRALGLGRIGLHVFGHNQTAIGLYASSGYRVTDLHMAKSLGPAHGDTSDGEGAR